MNKTFLRLKQNTARACRILRADILKYRMLIAAFLFFCIGAGVLFHKICIFRITTGYPCPGCGITRAFQLFFLLRWKEAFQMNPMIFVWLPLIAYAAFKRYFRGHKVTHFTALFISAGLLSLLVYLLRMIILYPDTPPMTYDSNNILRFIKNFITSIHFF